MYQMAEFMNDYIFNTTSRALINSGFKIIFHFGVQLPQWVGISFNTIDEGSTLCFLNLSIRMEQLNETLPSHFVNTNMAVCLMIIFNPGKQIVVKAN